MDLYSIYALIHKVYSTVVGSKVSLTNHEAVQEEKTLPVDDHQPI